MPILARCQNGNRRHYPLNEGHCPVREKACSLCSHSQAKKTCDYYYHDHHTDDVKDVHCVLLRVRDAICSRDGKSAIGAPRLVFSWVSQHRVTMRPSANVSLYKIAHAVQSTRFSMPYEHAYYCAPRNKSRLKQSLSSRCTAGFRAAYDRCGSKPVSL